MVSVISATSLLNSTFASWPEASSRSRNPLSTRNCGACPITWTGPEGTDSYIARFYSCGALKALYTVWRIGTSSYRIKLLQKFITNLTEIDKAVSRLKRSKVPGGDGFPAEWLKWYKDLVSLTLLKCFNYLGGRRDTSILETSYYICDSKGRKGQIRAQLI